MPLLIDCYNVLHQTMPPSLAGLDERALCVAVARRWHGQTAMIVCDGVVKPGNAAESPEEGVELIYAGRGKSADAVIMEHIAADSAPRRLLVVSSDREIQKAARRRRARVMSSEEFVRELGAGPGEGGRDQGGRPDPSRPLPPQEVDQWLERFGLKDAGREDGSP